jgi:hypothetical protein
MRSKSSVTTNFDSTEFILPDDFHAYAIQPSIQYKFTLGSMYEATDFNNYLIGPVGTYYQFEYRTDK